MLTLQGDVKIYADTLKYSDPKKESSVDELNRSKIYISRGAIVTNLDQFSRSELVYVEQVETVPIIKSPLKKEIRKPAVLQPEVKQRQYSTHKSAVAFTVPMSETDFHQKSRSRVLAFIVNNNHLNPKSTAVAALLENQFLFFSIVKESALELYLDNNSISRSVPTFFTRPPPTSTFA